MKRSELKRGMQVELRTYGDSFETVVVVDTEPWVDTVSRTSYRPSRFAPAAGWSKNRNGVAVAKLRRFLSTEEPDWHPAVVQLTQLFPVGTAAARRQAREVENSRKKTATEQAEVRKQQLTEALGLDKHDLRYPYRQYGSGPGYTDHGHVEISISKLEDLVTELQAYRRGEAVPTEFDLPGEFDPTEDANEKWLHGVHHMDWTGDTGLD